MNIRGIIILACALVVSVACVSTADQRNDKSIGYHEIIIPRESDKKQEVVDFDLYNLSIIGKEGKLDGLRENGGDHQESARNDQPFTVVSGSVTGHAEGSEEGNETTELVGNTDTDNSAIILEPEHSAETECADNNVYGSDRHESDMYESGSKGNECIVDKSGQTDTDSGLYEEPELTYLGVWTCTAYCPCEICCGEYATGYTASGTLATAGRTIACNVLPIGTEVMIDGNVYIVEDTGWSPYGDNWIDIFFNSHDEALAYGVQTREVYLVG